MDRYLELLEVDATTFTSYEGYIRNHIRPLLGRLPLSKLGGETLDSFYAILRICRDHCEGHPFVEHRIDGPHDCNDKCRAHTCRPLAASSVPGSFQDRQHWRWRCSRV